MGGARGMGGDKGRGGDGKRGGGRRGVREEQVEIGRGGGRWGDSTQLMCSSYCTV